MSKENFPEELAAVNNTTIASNDQFLSTTGFASDEANTSESDSESFEADGSESMLKKESEDLFTSEESDVEDNSQIPIDSLEADISTSSFEQESIEDVCESEEAEEDGTKNESFCNTEQRTIVSIESPLSPTKTLEDNSGTSSLEKGSIEDLFENEVAEQDGTGNKSPSYAEKDSTTSTKSPQLPTEALKSLSISDSPNSSIKTDHFGTSKTTQRRSRIRAESINIFDSPYNTRLKARMIRERDQRSRSEEGIK